MKTYIVIALLLITGCSKQLDEKRHERCLANDLDQSSEMLKRCMMRSM